MWEGRNSFFYLLLCVSINTNRGSLFDFRWPYRELKFKNVIREKIRFVRDFLLLDDTFCSLFYDYNKHV